MRKTSFAKEEYYHIYNRGVDKRSIFEDPQDLFRFLQTIREFNTLESNGGIYVNSFKERQVLRSSTSKLVRFITYCLNQNHYHFILQPLVENGVQKFMHKLSTGYTKFFNEKYARSGALFQGRYKAVHVKTNEQLLHLSVYTNLNDRVHCDINQKWLLELPFSSFKEYQHSSFKNGICDTSIILAQFESTDEYYQYAEDVLIDIIKRKEQEKLIKQLIID